MRERQNTAMSTEASPSGTCAQRGRAFDFLTVTRTNRRAEKKPTHFGHVADRHQLTDGCQVEAVHLVLHTARYLTVTTAEVCNHAGGRSGDSDTMRVYNQLHWHSSTEQ